MNAAKSFFLLSLAAFLALVQPLAAQLDFHTVPNLVREPTDVTITEDYAPFGHRPETDKAGDDGSFAVRDRNGVMMWITRDGVVNLIPNSTLAKAVYVSNSECIIFENRFRSTPPVFNAPEFDSIIAIHRLTADGAITTRRASFTNQKIVDTIPITPTTYGYPIVTAEYYDDEFEESTVSTIQAVITVNQWARRIYRQMRLTWTATDSATNLDVQFLTAREFDVPRSATALGDAAPAGFGNDGAILLNFSVARNYGIFLPAGMFFDTDYASFLFTFNIDAERITRITQIDQNPDNDDVPPPYTTMVPPVVFDEVAFVDNSRLLASSPILTLIGFDANGFPVYQDTGNYYIDDFRTRSNGVTTISNRFALDLGEEILPTGIYFREGFPNYVFSLINNNTQVRLSLIRTGLERLGAPLTLPTQVLQNTPLCRNSRDGSLLIRGEGSAGVLWIPTTVGPDGIATGLESIRSVPGSESGKPLHVSANEAVVWMNSDDPVDISVGAEIPPAQISHLRKNGLGLTETKLNIEGRYVATPQQVTYDPELEGWIITTYEKLRFNPRASRVRTYRLYLGGNADQDGDGLSDFDELFVHGTDPFNPDTDDDGLSDGQEVRPFQLINGTFTWTEARKDAIRRGGRLAVLENPTKQEGLRYVLATAIQKTSDAAWIGGNDVSTEGVYRWLTAKGGVNGPLLPTDPDHPFNNWNRPFQPTNLGDADGMAAIANGELSWAMFPDERRFPYILELKGSNPLIGDTDGDGLSDSEERAIGSDPTVADTDGDGLTDKEEQQAGSSPFLVDTDDDGLTDFEEVRKYRTNPTLPDTDNDGLEDKEEITRGTDPRKRDTDGDDLLDGDEVIIYGTKPLVVDTDSDGLSDGVEVDIGTNPLKPDTDGDGIKDGDEVNAGSDPLNSRDPRLLDDDNDGLFNYDELFIHGTDPNKKDTDGDGLTDPEEIRLGTDPTRKDTDRDGIPDGIEINVTFTDPRKPSTGNATESGTISFKAGGVAGDYEGIVVSTRGGQTFKQTLRLSSSGSFSTNLQGLRTNTSFKGKFSNNGVYVGKPGNTSDLKKVRMLVVQTSQGNYVVQGTYESRKGGDFYFQLRKTAGGAKSAGTEKLTATSSSGKGNGPKGHLVATGTMTNRSRMNLSIYMPDGSRSSFSAPVLKGNLVSMYSRSGDASSAVLTGMLKLRNVKDSSDFDGVVRYYSPGSGNGSFFPSGYDQQRSIFGAYYRSPSPGTLPLSQFRVRSNNATFRWLKGDFDGVLKAGTWTSDGKIIIPTGQTDSAITSFLNQTGLLKMTYTRTDSGRGLLDATSHVMAVAQQKQDSFLGFYLSDGSSAVFDVVPNKGDVEPDITSISPKSKMVSAAAQSYTVTVKTKGDWTVGVSGSDSWITAVVNSENGTGPSDTTLAEGDGTVVITVQQNFLYARRKAIITIAGIQHELTQEFR